VVLAVRPLSLYEAPEEVAILEVGVQKSIHLKMVYPERPAPPLSVEDVQERLICVEETAIAERPAGVVGAVLSTVTVVVAVLVLLLSVAVRV
jgi:hypothetical protein